MHFIGRIHYIGKTPSPKEVKKYLKFVSSVNSSIKKPQFHAAISCKGREFDKDQLTEIAEQWMKKMGYSEPPSASFSLSICLCL